MAEIKLASKVLRERLKRKWTPGELAKRAGIDRMTVVRVEEGHLPTVLNLIKIAGAFDKPPAWFLQ